MPVGLLALPCWWRKKVWMQMDGGSGQGSLGSPESSYCGSCGQRLDASAVYCANCGRPVVRPAAAAGDALPTAAGAAPAAAVPPPMPAAAPPWQATPSYAAGWPTYQQPTVAGMAGLAAPTSAGPLPQPASAPRRGRRGLMLVGVSGVLLVAVLASLSFYIFNVLAAHGDLDAARYLPANTAVYVSVDVVNAATNGHHVSINDLTQNKDQSDAIRKATGLEWKDDVLPWLGRGIAFAAFPNGSNSNNGSTPADAILPFGQAGAVFLLQSRDDGRAQAALAKAADFQKQQPNTTVDTTSYNGFTIYRIGGASPSIGLNGTAPGVEHAAFASGKGWAILSTSVSNVQAVIDRLNGASDTLANSAAFRNATSGLPAGRFGTLYVSLRDVARLGSSNQSVPLFDIYPTAVGYTSWTDPGERTQITLKAGQPLGVGTLSGDTTALAGLVPANALGYVGVANLGAAITAAGKLTSKIAPSTASSGANASDPLQAGLGVSASDPVFQHPAAIAVLNGSSNFGPAPQPVLLLQAPDAAAVTAALQKAATTQGWTLKPTQIAGHDATEIDHTVSEAIDQNGPPVPVAGTDAPNNGLEVVLPLAYAAVVNGTAIIAGTQDAVGAIIQAGTSGATLAQSATFSQLVGQAPKGAAITGYVDIHAIEQFGLVTSAGLGGTSSTGGTGGTGGTSASAAAAPLPTALLLTQVWDDTQLQTTLDVKLSS